ncbi:MAG: DNA polymerase I [Ktedonobacterales bacterium]
MSSSVGQQLVLIDGHALFHRSFHAFPEEMTTQEGQPTNAVYGFTRMLLDVLRIIRPDYLIVTFDRPTPTFRHKEYTPYKAHRPPLPETMRPQFPRVRDVVHAFGIPIYELDGFEADDVLGTPACRAEKRGMRVAIATGDLDTLQLVDAAVRVTFARAPRRGEFEYFDVAAVEAKYGFLPPRLVDYKALVGDTSDNLPGVPGIGQKTATRLIADYGPLEDILAHVDALPARTAALLREHEAQARQSKHLATIVTDAPVTLDLAGARALHYDPNTVLQLFRELEFYSLVDRLPRRANADEPLPGVVGTGAPAATAPRGTEVALAPEPEDADGGNATAQLSLFAESDLQVLAEQGQDVPLGNLAATLPPPRPHREVPTVTNTMVIDTPGGLDVLARTLAASTMFAFDLETDSTDELRTHIVGLAFSMGRGEAYYIPVGHGALPDGTPPGRQLPLAHVIERLGPVLGDPGVGKVAHNAKFDMMVLARQGIWTQGLRFDTMVAAYLLNPGRRGLSLKDQAFENLNLVMTPITDLIGTGRQQLTMVQVPITVASQYAGADAEVTFRLMELLEPQLRARGLDGLFSDVEVPLIPVLARMELAGILVDPAFLRRMGRDLEEQTKALEQDIYAAVGHQFNINSTKQLGEVLFKELKLPPSRKTKTGYSVDAEVLEGLSGQHAAVDTLLEYRQLAKLKSTYVDGLLELINPDDQRVHTSFNQTIASTGRLSSSNPNLQNIPVRTEVGKRIRRAFLADPGCYLLTADYSQIELRILAHITGEPALVEAFARDDDVHAATAARLFHVPLEQVTSDQRRLAKTTNFAVLYGQSAFGLSRVTSMSRSEAAEFIRTYDETFPLVREYMQRTLRQAHTEGFVQTLLGRRRYLPDLAQLPPALRQAAEREAVNMPIQGTNADMIKIAMVHLQAQLEERKLRSRMILQVHDALVLEVPDEEMELARELVRGAMVGAMPLNVPVKVDMKAGRNWYDVVPLQ